MAMDDVVEERKEKEKEEKAATYTHPPTSALCVLGA
jgi:hypothetical protein